MTQYLVKLDLGRGVTLTLPMTLETKHFDEDDLRTAAEKVAAALEARLVYFEPALLGAPL